MDDQKHFPYGRDSRSRDKVSAGDSIAVSSCTGLGKIEPRSKAMIWNCSKTDRATY
jgi:hypothetical protein